MSTLTFDTLAYAKCLKAADVPEKQAEAQAEALRAALNTQDLVTQKDLEIALAPVRGELKVLRVMLGLVLTGVLALVLKTFF